MNAKGMKLWLAGMLCLGLTAPVWAEESNSSQPSSGSDSSAMGLKSAMTTGAPTRFNRASSLIGMDVRNEQGQKLGDIKDIVIDTQTGKVSYVVLGSGGVLGMDQKLLAVPLTALTRNTKDKCMELQATKESVAEAKGIGQFWPSVQQPSFSAMPFWQTNTQTAPPKQAQPSGNTKPETEQ